jgi:hypothetical protein
LCRVRDTVVFLVGFQVIKYKRGHQYEKWGLEWDGLNLHEEIKWEALSGQKLWTTIIKITDRNTGTGSLVHAVKKVYQLRTVIIGAGSANSCFESGYSWKLKEN